MNRAASDQPSVSVILPSYGSAAAVEESLCALIPELESTCGQSWEIIVVDDGGQDLPPGFAGSRDEISLIQFPENRGKGAAVRAGILTAEGATRIYTDVDLPYGTSLIPVMESHIRKGPFHLVIGDRRHSQSTATVRRTVLRETLSSVASAIVGAVVTGGFFDTQCGLKAIRGDVADLLFPQVRIDSYAFDVEVIYLALSYNCEIKRIPVDLQVPQSTSTVRPLRDGLIALRDIIAIKLRARNGAYECPALERLINGRGLVP